MAKRPKIMVLVAIAVLLVLSLLSIRAISARYRLTQVKDGTQTGAQPTPNASKSIDKAAQERQARLDQLYQQGYGYYNQKNYKEAINLLDQVIAEDPGYYPAYTVKGIALCFDGRFDEGMKNIDRALELKPDYGSARFNKALAYELYAHYDTALYWYDQTIAVEPNSVWSYYGKASIYGRRGDVAETVKNLKQAIDLNPEVKKYAREEKDFDNVRNSPEFRNLVNN